MIESNRRYICTFTSLVQNSSHQIRLTVNFTKIHNSCTLRITNSGTSWIPAYQLGFLSACQIIFGRSKRQRISSMRYGTYQSSSPVGSVARTSLIGTRKRHIQIRSETGIYHPFQYCPRRGRHSRGDTRTDTYFNIIIRRQPDYITLCTTACHSCYGNKHKHNFLHTKLTSFSKLILNKCY